MMGKGFYWKKSTETDRTINPHDEPQRIQGISRAFGNMTFFKDGDGSAGPAGKIECGRPT